MTDEAIKLIEKSEHGEQMKDDRIQRTETRTKRTEVRRQKAKEENR